MTVHTDEALWGRPLVRLHSQTVQQAHNRTENSEGWRREVRKIKRNRSVLLPAGQGLANLCLYEHWPLSTSQILGQILNKKEAFNFTNDRQWRHFCCLYKKKSKKFKTKRKQSLLWINCVCFHNISSPDSPAGRHLMTWKLKVYLSSHLCCALGQQ